MSDQQLAVREATALMQPRGFDNPTRELIRKTISDPRNPLTTDEFDLFIAVCEHIGANPLLREAYALKDRGGRMSVAIGIDKFRQQTQADPRFVGQAGPQWCGRDGVWKDVWLEDSAPAAARVGIWLRGAREPTWGVATFKAYGRESPQWKQNPAHMLAIRAEAHAHRKCSSRLSGPVVLREDEEPDRPGYVDADGVIDEGHPTRALAPRRRSAADFSDEPIPTTLEPDQMTPFEQEQPPAVAPVSAEVALARDVATAEADAAIEQVEQANHPVSEATKLACAAFVDQVKAVNPKLRIALPPEAEGEGAWRRWLADKQAAWRTSPHNPSATPAATP